MEIISNVYTHQVRHAHGVHQLEVEDRDALKSVELFDAQLSPQGWQQVISASFPVCFNHDVLSTVCIISLDSCHVHLNFSSNLTG